MTTVRHLRTSARRLHAVEESVDSALLTFSVVGQPFAWVNTESSTLRVALPSKEAAGIIEDLPSARRVQRPTGVEISLSELNGMAANSLLRRASSHRRRQDIPAPASVIDLPREIGRPATRALTEHGIGSLTDVAHHSRAEIAELHGVGPKAIQLLTSALADRGEDWR